MSGLSVAGGYSRIAGAHEDGIECPPSWTLKGSQRPAFANHRGRIVKRTGDGSTTVLQRDRAPRIGGVACKIVTRAR